MKLKFTDSNHRNFLKLMVIVVGILAMPLPAVLQAAPREHVVSMSSMSYGRIPAGIRVGDTIVWVNNDTVPHTVTARDKSFDLRLASRKRSRMTATKAGTFAIYCAIHPAMRGTLVVGP